MDPPAGPPAAARPAESTAAVSPASASSPARYKVLVVDDDEDSRTLVRQTLLLTPDFTSDVTLADSAKAGLAWLDQEKFDVVISDQIMPETNGIEFLMEVKQRFPETLRILITAHTGLETVLRAVNLAQPTRTSRSLWTPSRSTASCGRPSPACRRGASPTR